MLRDVKANEIARKVLTEKLEPNELISVNTGSEEDFDGANVLRIRVLVRHSLEDIQARLDLTLALQEALRERDDDRYVFLDVDTKENADRREKELSEEEDDIFDGPHA